MTAYTATFQPRFDECVPDGTVRASALLRYTVETAFSHSAHLGFPLAWYDARGLYWLVRRVDLALAHGVPYGTALAVTTQVVGFRRISARRHNVIRTGAGRVAGEIVMDWIFTDREGTPTRVAPEMEAAFPGLQDTFHVEHLELPTPPAHAAWGSYPVLAHQVDPRGHMNTAAYLDLFEDVLVNAGVDVQQRPAVYELEFLRSSPAGERLAWSCWADAGTWMAVVANADGTPVARARRR